MKVLISAASKHGATAEIAQAIGAVISSAGIETDVRRPEDVLDVEPYDAVILGSGVYAGRWLGPAKKLAERESAMLATKPVWLFSSGPTGGSAKPVEEPADVARVRVTTHAIDHRVFAGKLDPNQLGLAERTIIKVVHAPSGDFRAWDEVTTWASGIVATLQATAAKRAVHA